MRDNWILLQLTFPPDAANLAEELIATASTMQPTCGSSQDATDPRKWSVYFERADEAANFKQQLTELASDAGIASLDTSEPTEVPRENWHDGWRQYFKPVELGDRILIVPAWEEDLARSATAQGKLALRLEPGMAFGTGTHATTQLCLQIAEGALRAGDRVLDVGTGSGVLAIAAMKLGAVEALGTDIDPEVEENFDENLRLNEVSPAQVKLLIGDGEGARDKQFDFIFCNMLMNEFTPLLPGLSTMLKTGGRMILSGLLATEEDEVTMLLKPLPLSIKSRHYSGEWAALLLEKV